MPRPKADPEDPVSGWCEGCGEPCGGHAEDFGESYGDRGYRENWQWVSDCCEEPILDHAPHDPDEDDDGDDDFDPNYLDGGTLDEPQDEDGSKPFYPPWPSTEDDLHRVRIAE